MDDELSDGAQVVRKLNSRRRSEGFKRPGFMQLVKMDNSEVTSEKDRSQMIMTPHTNNAGDTM